MITALAIMLSAAFDLSCVGNETYSDDMRPRSSAERPFRDIYRVDLKSQRWCSGQCVETRAIQEITDRSIILSANDGDRSTADWVHIEINRESGKYSYDLVLATKFSFRKGICSRAQFSGFPSRKF